MKELSLADMASHMSASQDGERYSETVRYNNNEGDVTAVSENRKIFTDKLVDRLISPVMYLNELVEWVYTQESTLHCKSTLVDISAVYLDNAQEYLKDYQSALILSPHNSVVALNVPSTLRRPLLRKTCGANAPYYERTIEDKNAFPVGWKSFDDGASFFDLTFLYSFYAGLCQVVTAAFDEVLPSRAEPISIQRAKKIFQSRKSTAHFKLRFDLMYDEKYTFRNGKEFTSFGAYVEVLVDGGFIQKIMQTSGPQKAIKRPDEGIDVLGLLGSFEHGTLQEEIAKTSPYVLMMLFMLFDDKTTTELVSQLSLTKNIKQALKILSLNLDEAKFVTFDPKVLVKNKYYLNKALEVYGISAQREDSLRYEQMVRVTNILLHIKK